MATVLTLLPRYDYDPTEAAVPWAALKAAGHQVLFATPDGHPAYADRLLTDIGFGLLTPLLMTAPHALLRYQAMIEDADFLQPIRHAAWSEVPFDGLLIPGGHAPGVKTLLDSEPAQSCVQAAFARNRAVAAICHGPVLLSRSRDAGGRSVLHGRRTTALTQLLEYSGFLLTALSHGRYYRTYRTPVEVEVKAALSATRDFVRGPLPLRRDSPDDLSPGFAMRDGNYVSARWPGDAYRFAQEFVSLLG